METKRHLIIGYDAKRMMCNDTGLGNYSRNLVNALIKADKDTEFRLYSPCEGREDLKAQILPAKNISFIFPRSMHCRIRRDLWRAGGMVKDLLRDKVHLFHGLSGELPHGLHKAGIPGIVTVHDLIFLRHPEYYHWIDAKIYARKFYVTCREASRMVAISECTKRDILAYSHFPEDRIDVIYQSCGTQFKAKVSEGEKQRIKTKYELPDRYILNVGTIEKRKNVLLAVKSLLRLPESLSLVIVGKATKYVDEVQAFIIKHQLESRVRFMHNIPNEDLPAIYQLASVFVYPSRYEGFGLPVIEGIQSGLPVVACTGSCLEEAGGPDNLYVAPDDDEGMANGIALFLGDASFRQQSIGRSMSYVKRFENQDLAHQMLQEYQKLI
ncbi:MAG: glycosyltransferase family 4 protein [Prevotella sp.]|jgi:glycosyltransferase involved in cell wall biosynthesis|nr:MULTISPECIES: glycosyltransferase family 1 protein [unclassified Prevotella]MCH3969451.1 glycosyltransferase family 4 protein [Prevotella sp.]MCH3991658.1 glycosyltransferase family 4 protein [Prevotella sp.]MCH4018819.1 glycosyltransferase family 4 protein [Prevotella sp.]MCH4186241.1 glycosyltransferase family 4 protein [Prevotella sp.]MCH4216050.1 glycosyltransferase family 4 protein [Prevotella sp.]